MEQSNSDLRKNIILSRQLNVCVPLESPIASKNSAVIRKYLTRAATTTVSEAQALTT